MVVTCLGTAKSAGIESPVSNVEFYSYFLIYCGEELVLIIGVELISP